MHMLFLLPGNPCCSLPMDSHSFSTKWSLSPPSRCFSHGPAMYPLKHCHTGSSLPAAPRDHGCGPHWGSLSFTSSEPDTEQVLKQTPLTQMQYGTAAPSTGFGNQLCVQIPFPPRACYVTLERVYSAFLFLSLPTRKARMTTEN